jgi:hypothetical protein
MVATPGAGCETPAMDPEMQAKADLAAAALERDVHLLEHEAAKAGASLAKKLAPAVGAFLLLAFAGWLLGRRSRRRQLARGAPPAI